MTTTYKNIRDAIKTRLQTWTATPVHWAGTKFNPAPGVAYIQPRMIFAGAEQVTMGTAGMNRVSGDLHTNIFTPVGAGDDESMVHADALRALFPRGLKLAAGARNITFDVPEVRESLEEQDWYQLPVICPFYLDEV